MNPTLIPSPTGGPEKVAAPKPTPEPPPARPWYSPSELWQRKTTIIAAFSIAAILVHHIPLPEDAVNRGERGLKEAGIAGRDRQDAMRQIDILLTLGHRHNPINLLGQHPMQRLLGTRSQIGQAQSLARQVLPAQNATMLDRQDHATASHNLRDALNAYRPFLGGD